VGESSEAREEDYLKYLEIRISKGETIFDKILFELCISFLIPWSALIAELIEGDIFDPALH
jgi:hypothetical protein